MCRKKDREAFFASRRLFLYSAMPSDGVRQQEISDGDDQRGESRDRNEGQFPVGVTSFR